MFFFGRLSEKVFCAVRLTADPALAHSVKTYSLATYGDNLLGEAAGLARAVTEGAESTLAFADDEF